MDVDRDKTLVVRIKRKATEPPLSALVIQDSIASSSTGFGTPKKRRDVSGRPRGVFRLADTVPDSWVGKGEEGEVLRERIKELMQQSQEQAGPSENGVSDVELTRRATDQAKAEVAAAVAARDTSGIPAAGEGRDGKGNGDGNMIPMSTTTSLSGMKRDRDVKSNKRLDGDLSRQATPTPTQGRSSEGTPGGSTPRTGIAPLPPINPEHGLRTETMPDVTTVGAKSLALHPLTPPRRSSSLPTPTAAGPSTSLQYRVMPPTRQPRQQAGLPPVVLREADLIAAARSQFRFIDAQAVNNGAGASGAGSMRTSDGQIQRNQAASPDEAEADPQMAAFQDMLSEYLRLENRPVTIARPEAVEEDEEDEYVIDLYYRSVEAFGEGNQPVQGTDIGALLGFDDLSPPSTPSESEPEDEADEDSNDEDYYRNDYPEDEDADEDMEDFQDAFGSDDEEEVSDERGLWDYR